MPQPQRVIVWFSELTRKDIALAGGKGASLGEMASYNIPVPPGFVVTSDSYAYFLEKSGLSEKIKALMEELDPSNIEQVHRISSDIKAMIMSSPMPPHISEAIKEAYLKLDDGPVAVRSSATTEDSAAVSFAGQHSTFLNVTGSNAVVDAVQRCWASVFEPRAIVYRERNNIDHLNIRMAVPVQKMVQPRVSGVMFTVEPVRKDEDEILLEAVYGLGESLVSGEVTPDEYIVSKKSLDLIESSISPQKYELIRSGAPWTTPEAANIKVDVPAKRQTEQKLTEEQIKAIAKLGRDLEGLYGFPVDIEWAVQNDDIYIIQTRPITA